MNRLTTQTSILERSDEVGRCERAWEIAVETSCELYHQPADLHLGLEPQMLDRIKIGRVGWVPDEEGASALNSNRDSLLLKVGESAVTRSIVQDNDAARARVGIEQGRQDVLEEMNDVGGGEALTALDSESDQSEIALLAVPHCPGCDNSQSTDDARVRG